MIGLPFWSVSWNGPPIAALVLASGDGPRPVTMQHDREAQHQPGEERAESMSSRRWCAWFIDRYRLADCAQKHAAIPAAMISKNTAVP